MSKPVSRRGISNSRAAFLDASRALADRQTAIEPDPNAPRGDIKPGKWDGAPWDGMPPDCPIQVLGHNGSITYIMAANGQLFDVEKIDQQVITRLFAPRINYALWAWPAFSKAGTDENGEPIPARVVRLERDKCAAALIQEGVRQGLFDPKDRVRGRGGWRDKGDRFVWHSGEYLWTVDGGKLKAAQPGLLDGMLYGKAPDVQRPWEEPVGAEISPAPRLLQQLQTWSWERPELDPILFLGWFVTAYMGGALDWRPTVFTTGGAGVGKSTLHGVVQRLFGPSLHATADTTAAGIYQRVKQDSLPVTVDELENKPGSSKATAVIELARLAASGARLYRGGQDHEGVDFQARNSFLFSAINPPPLGVQDRSRMAILNLARLDASRKAASMDLKESDGRMILRQVMEGWSNFHGALLPHWKRALHDAGMDSRAQDTYGTLIAAANLVLGDEVMAANGLDVTDLGVVAGMVAAETESERAEQTDNWQACLEHLLASTIDNWKSGERPTIGGTLELLTHVERVLGPEEARARLASAGLGLKMPKDVAAMKGTKELVDHYGLAIPTAKSPQLVKIFADTIWGNGVWADALKQGPKDVILRGGKENRNGYNVKIAGVVRWSLVVDLKAFEKLTAV